MGEEPFPPELWNEIFESSCIDGGTTGVSLSLVSKSFNIISAPFKFKSVSLRSVKSVSLFLDNLENTPPRFRYVQYLNIGLDSDAVATFLSTSTDPEIKKLYKNLLKIFELCADRLLILSVRLHHPEWRISATTGLCLIPLGSMPEFCMPSLVELTWIVIPHENVEWSSPCSPEEMTFPPSKWRPMGPIRFPSLELLYLDMTVEETMDAKIAYHCPELRYLRSQLDTFSFMGSFRSQALRPAPWRCDPELVWKFYPGPGRAASESNESDPTTPTVRYILDVPIQTRYLEHYLERRNIGYQDIKICLGPECVFSFPLAPDPDSRDRNWEDRVLGKQGYWRYEEWVFEPEPVQNHDYSKRGTNFWH
ncbi:hypothetical protein BDN72DRAFT_897381 [Pluteus cervinus]|uniref:Uncharacterized protein n=1 Tax=Pluteus cervinus TaxID=181527 RepID=A0ACD3ATJ1_9AGAR|nr:hypothetical protein BDN72DRAFT_897381 [Pluteus cervinus]